MDLNLDKIRYLLETIEIRDTRKLTRRVSKLPIYKLFKDNICDDVCPSKMNSEV